MYINKDRITFPELLNHYVFLFLENWGDFLENRGEVYVKNVHLIMLNTDQSHSLYDDVPDLQPTLQWQHLKQSQHGTPNVVKVKVVWIGPALKWM